MDMQATQTQFAEDYRIEVPVQDKSGSYYVFFAGDLVAPALRSSIPHLAPGGVVNDALTLRHANGFIRQCLITPLREYMWTENRRNVMPEKQDQMVRTYKIIQDGKEVTVGLNQNGNWDGLLRRMFYPSADIGRVTSQADGIVRMPVNSSTEARRAQYFLFPEWDDYLTGVKALPRKISTLKAYFQERLALATDDFERGVASAAIQSCDQFISKGSLAIAKANAELKRAQVKGEPYYYPGDVELYFEQLGIQRSDLLVQDQGSKFDMMAEAITKLAQRDAAVDVAPAPVDVLTDDERAVIESYRQRTKAAETLVKEKAAEAKEVEPAKGKEIKKN